MQSDLQDLDALRGAVRAGCSVFWANPPTDHGFRSSFTDWAAERAVEFRFHPTQTVEPQGDGSLIVKFQAAGWLEMAWHLYQWGALLHKSSEGIHCMNPA